VADPRPIITRSARIFPASRVPNRPFRAGPFFPPEPPSGFSANLSVHDLDLKAGLKIVFPFLISRTRCLPLVFCRSFPISSQCPLISFFLERLFFFLPSLKLNPYDLSAKSTSTPPYSELVPPHSLSDPSEPSSIW